MGCQIEIEPFEVSVHIGCGAEERATAQPLRIQAWLKSSELFPAAFSDELADTVDVEEMKRSLLKTLRVAEQSEIKTLEKLATLLVEGLVGLSRFPVEFEIRLTKPNAAWTYVQTAKL